MIFSRAQKIYSLQRRTIGLFLVLIFLLCMMVFSFAYTTTRDEYEKKLYFSMEYFAALIDRNLLNHQPNFFQGQYRIDQTDLWVKIIPLQTPYQHHMMDVGNTPYNPSFSHTSAQNVTLIFNTPQYQLQIEALRAEIHHNVFRLTLQHILLPYIVIAPVTIILLLAFLWRGLHPLTVLRRQIDQRHANDFTPLSLDLLPLELVPLINALNLMFERMQLYQKQQRQFVANAAHELRTPITALNLQLHILKNFLDNSEDALKSYNTTESGVLRLQNLVNQMMSLAHQESSAQDHALQLLNISDLLRTCIEQLYPAIEAKDINLSIEQLDSIHMYAHPEQINSIIFNLLDNAIKYTPRYGIINISLYVDQRFAHLGIADSGSGIQAEEAQKVFERFYRLNTHSHIIGSGLGLSIVKIAVDQLNGTINLAPSELGGLLVSILIPLSTANTPDTKT